MVSNPVEQGNQAIAQKFIDAYNSMDTNDPTEAMKRLADLMTEDATISFPALGVTQGRRWEVTGAGAAALVSQRKIEVRRMIVSDNTIAVEMLWSGISAGLPGTAPVGERVEMQNCIILSFRGDRISEYVEYLGCIQGINLQEITAGLLGG